MQLNKCIKNGNEYFYNFLSTKLAIVKRIKLIFNRELLFELNSYKIKLEQDFPDFVQYESLDVYEFIWKLFQTSV